MVPELYSVQCSAFISGAEVMEKNDIHSLSTKPSILSGVGKLSFGLAAKCALRGYS